MLDGVKGGDAAELSLLLALRGGGSSFSHIVLISGLWPRCGRVKAAGVPPLSSPRLRPRTPRAIQGCVRVALARPCLLFARISAVTSPTLRFAASFLSSWKTLVSGKQWSSCHFCFSPPPLPRAIVGDGGFVCVLRLLLKIKNSLFHPLYCFLVGCPCHSFRFMSSLDIWVSPLFKGYLCRLPAAILFQGGINNFTETFIERLIAGISHGSVVVRNILQRQTQVFGGISKRLVTTTSVSVWGLFAGRPPWPCSS